MLVVQQFFKFGIIGVVNNAVTYGLFFFLHRFWGWHYLLASFVGYSTGVACSFILNALFTFRYEHSKVRVFHRFVIVNCVSLAANVFLVYIFTEVFGIPPVFSQLIIIPIIMTVNFLGSKFYVFTSAS